MLKILERCYLQMKNMKWKFFVPLVVLYIIIPLMVYSFTFSPLAPRDPNTTLVDICYLLVPVFSVWWLYLSLKEYLEGEGNELLVMYNGIGQMSAVFFCITVITYLPVFLFFDNTADEITNLFLQMTVASFLMYGIVLATAVVFRSVAISILAALCYAIWGTSTADDLSFIKYGNMMGSSMWFEESLPLVIIGVIFWAYGVFHLKRYRS